MLHLREREAINDLVGSTFGAGRVRHGSTDEGVWRPVR